MTSNHSSSDLLGDSPTLLSNQPLASENDGTESPIGQEYTALYKTFVFSSEWVFKTDGIKEVSEQLEKATGYRSPTYYLVWHDEDHTFRLSCVQELAPMVFDEFLTIIEKLIAKESAENDSDDEVESVSEDNGIEYYYSSKISKIRHLSSSKPLDLPKPGSQFEGTARAADRHQLTHFPIEVNPDTLKYVSEQQMYRASSTIATEAAQETFQLL